MPAQANSSDNAERISRSGAFVTRREPIQMPGSEPASNCANSGQSTEPSEAWPKPATSVRGTA